MWIDIHLNARLRKYAMQLLVISLANFTLKKGLHIIQSVAQSQKRCRYAQEGEMRSSITIVLTRMAVQTAPGLIGVYITHGRLDAKSTPYATCFQRFPVIQPSRHGGERMIDIYVLSQIISAHYKKASEGTSG